MERLTKRFIILAGFTILRGGLLLLVMMGVTAPTYSKGVSENLKGFFNTLGTSTNTSRAGAYKDQSAGFYTGGSLFARNTVHTAQLASLRLPDYRAGCGGIDMHFGAFSFISGEELVKALRTLGSNMGSYALLLALETMSSQVKNIITELNDLAQKVNQSNINSCEFSATTLGALLPQAEVGNRQLCTMIGSDSRYGGFSDYAAARQGCGAGGKRDSVLDAGKNDPRFAKMLGSEFNLAWNAIQENAFLSQDKKLAEFFMSISGTIISTKRPGGGYMLRTRPSLADRDSFLNALLYGGKVKIFECADSSDNKCLKVVDEEITITSENCFVSRVKTFLQSIQNKIYEDEELTQAEKDFLNSTRLPFYKIINVSTAYRRGSSPVDLIDYSELGAIDILFQYLSEILDLVNESAAHIRSTQIDDTQIRKFQKELNVARQRVVQKRMGSFKQVEQIISITKKTELLEKMLAAKLSTMSETGI